MIFRITEHVIHHHGVGHRGENRAETIFAIQPFIDETHRRFHRPLPRVAREQRINCAQHGIHATEQREPALMLMRRTLGHAGVDGGIEEQFIDAPVNAGMAERAPHQHQGWFALFRCVDAVLRAIDPLFPRHTRQRAVEAAVSFVDERLNGEDGLGAIFPAMANSVMMYDVLGYPEDHPHRAIARKSIEKLLVINEDEAYCQPCLSPVWDTSLAAHALLETGEAHAEQAAERGLAWLRPLQILDVRGDWISRRPNVRPGGWAFQYNNAHYPDVDDTAVVVLALDRAWTSGLLAARPDEAIDRAREWVE